MSKIMKEIITNKIKQTSPEELLHYGKKYGFTLTPDEAKQITTYIRSHPFDPFSESERAILFKELAKITDARTAKKAQNLFNELVKSYGLQSLF